MKRCRYNPRIPKRGSMGARARQFVSRHIRHHIRDLGMEPKKAVRAAYEEARDAGFKVPKPNPRAPFWKGILVGGPTRKKKRAVKKQARARANPVIGDEVLSITYRGGKGKRKSRLPFIHRFEHPVKALGRKDGSVVLKSTRGIKLWDWF